MCDSIVRRTDAMSEMGTDIVEAVKNILREKAFNNEYQAHLFNLASIKDGITNANI